MLAELDLKGSDLDELDDEFLESELKINDQ